MVSINTKRLLIRELKDDDLQSHHQLMSNDIVMTYIEDIKTHSLEESSDNLNFCIAESYKKDRQCYFLAIEELSSKKHVGSIGFTIVERNESGGNCELGYFIHECFWGLGYTTEAAKAVISYAFEELNLHKITTGCMAENVSSEKIMIKLGMKKEGHLVQHVLHNGIWKDRVEYALIKNS